MKLKRWIMQLRAVDEVNKKGMVVGRIDWNGVVIQRVQGHYCPPRFCRLLLVV